MPDSLNKLIFFDNSPLPAWVCEPKTLKVIYVNQAAVRMFGFSKAQWLKNTLHSRLTGVELKKNKLPVLVKMAAKNGSVHHLQVHSNTLVHEGKKLALFVAHDLPGNGVVKKQIPDLPRDFQKAITNASIISSTDENGIITYVNKNFVKISGYSSKELVGQPHSIINSGYHPESFWSGMWHTITQGKTWRGEIKNKTKSGTCFWVDTFIMPFLDAEGNILKFVSIHNDIAYRKHTEELLLKVNERLGDTLNFARMGSAELNIPLFEITISPELLWLLDIQSTESCRMPIHQFIEQFIVEEDRNAAYEKIQDGIDGGTLPKVEVAMEFRAVTATGRIILIDARGIFRPDTAFGILHDITDKRRTEVESAAKTRQIKNILNSITDVFFAVDKQWNFILTNDRFQEIHGHKGENLAGKNLWETFPHLRDSIVYEQYHQAMRSGKAGYFEFSGGYPKGMVYDIHMYPYTEGLFVYFRDISQRKKNEEEAERLALIASRTSNAVILTDREGHITWVNEGFERITEFTLAEVFGKTPGSFLQGPDTNAQTISYVRNCLANAKGFRTEILNYSKSRRKYWIDIEVMPVKDDDGEVTGFMAIESDITVLKTAIYEMLKSQVQLQTIMDNAPLVVSLKDLRGNYTFYNKSFVKYFPGNYPYKAVTDYDIFSKEDADSFRATDDYIIQTGKTIEAEHDITVNGKKDSYYTIKFPLQNDDDKVYAVGGVSLRITDRRQAALELQQNRITLKKQNRILEVINQIQLQFIKDVKPAIFFETVLRHILTLTRSEFGFIGEVLYKSGQRCLKVYSITDIAWDDQTQERYEENPQEGLEFYNVKTLFESVLANGKPVMVNASPDNLYNGMMPDGHPVLKAFLGIPIFKGTRQVGMIGLANRPEGYDDILFKELQPLAGVLGSIIEAFRNDQRRRQAEESLRESEQRFRVMADSAPVMIWMSDIDKMCNYVNKGWLDYTGSSLENALGNGWTNGIHPDDIAKCIEIYETSFDKQVTFAMEYRLLRYDVEYRWIVDNGSPRHLPNGEFIGYIGTCMDIHERKLVEQSLLKSESRYRSIVENQQEMICRYTKDGKLTFVNQSYVDTFGYKIHELIGKDFFDFLPKETHDSGKTFISRIFKGELEPDPAEHIILVKGEKRWQHWINLPLKNAEGEVYEVQAIGHDVTKRKELEAEQARLDKIVRESYNEIYLFNWDTLRFEFANASALRNIGYEQRELSEKKLSDLFSYPNEMALQTLLNPLRCGETDRLQLQIKHNRKDGTYYDVDTLIQVLEKDRSFVVIATDITEKLKTEKKLLATILEKETLIKEIHHRVKNNLQLISSIIYIKMASLEEPSLRHFLESTRQRIHSVALIHERLLQSEKIDKVDISDYLGKLVYDLKITNYRQDLSLEIKTDIQENVLDLDTAIYCGLIVNELITNAIKYAFTNRIVGVIEVGLKREESSFLLSVIDNGITMPVDIMPGESSSFGMNLLEIFVRQLGGTVEVIREKGTKFQIRF